MGDDHRIELVRGVLSPERNEQILEFWSTHSSLSGVAARQRLAQVVGVVVDDAGDVVGTSSVYPDRVPLIGDRRFWIYRRLFAPGVPEPLQPAMLTAVIGSLEEDRRGDPDEPVGICVLLDDPEEMRSHPEAVWPDTGMLYAGYQPDGRQVRIRYFAGAHIA